MFYVKTIFDSIGESMHVGMSNDFLIPSVDHSDSLMKFSNQHPQ